MLTNKSWIFFTTRGLLLKLCEALTLLKTPRAISTGFFCSVILEKNCKLKASKWSSCESPSHKRALRSSWFKLSKICLSLTNLSSLIDCLLCRSHKKISFEHRANFSLSFFLKDTKKPLIIAGISWASRIAFWLVPLINVLNRSAKLLIFSSSLLCTASLSI